jgi:tetratricopeptide (TPR) repeat protein
MAVETGDRTGLGQEMSSASAPDAAAAADFLERALKAGCQDPNVAYMLALAYKRQGKVAEARNALRKILGPGSRQPPDANVFLQMGLLSLQERQLAQAEQEFAQAWKLDPACYEVCYNLLLTRLTLGQMEACLGLIPQALELSSSLQEHRFLELLQALLRCCQSPNGDHRLDPVLTELSAEEEQRLLQVVRSLGQLDTAYTLMKALYEARPASPSVQEAYVEVVLVKAKDLFDRACTTQAEQLLTPLVRLRGVDRPVQAALFNLLGCCACLNQDFEGGVRHLSAALKLAGSDARVYQNLALAHELQGQLPQADPHWNRYFDLLDQRLPTPPGQRDYVERLAFEGLNRLAACYSEKERWSTALGYVQRAQRLRPKDPEMLERLFHLYQQAKRPEDARRTLKLLREVRPGDPQLDLFELDLAEVKSLGDIERMLSEIDRILKKYPNEPRVEERAVNMVGNVVPLMGSLCDQLTEQMSRVINQVRNLRSNQINWSAVQEVMQDLLREFQRLRRITNKCMPLVTHEEHRRVIRELTEHIDRKIEVCRSMSA